MDLVVRLLRFVQVAGATILFGSSLFFLYALPVIGPGSAAELRWPRRLLAGAALAILLACLLGFFAQTAVLAGSWADAITSDALTGAMGMSFGRSSMVRGITAATALAALLVMRPGRAAWWCGVVTGAMACGSFAWMGHGAATEGPWGLLHLASDVLHTLAAGIWIGALVDFLALLTSRPHCANHDVLYRALHGFSGIGSALVAVLVATGLINSWFVIGLAGVPQLWATTYGRLLTIKVAAFLLMVGLAAANRFYLTPHLGAAVATGSSSTRAIGALRGSLAMETGLSILVLGLVAWFGALSPPSAP